MPAILPPTPTGVPPGHVFWNQWYEQLRNFINSSAISVLWANINFTGANITAIPTRLHNTLQGIQGGSVGEAYHLNALQLSRAISVISKVGLPTTADLTPSTWAVYKDTAGGSLRLWANDGGTMKSVTLT